MQAKHGAKPVRIPIFPYWIFIGTLVMKDTGEMPDGV